MAAVWQVPRHLAETECSGHSRLKRKVATSEIMWHKTCPESSQRKAPRITPNAKRQAYIICDRLLGSILEGRVHLKIGPFLGPKLAFCISDAFEAYGSHAKSSIWCGGTGQAGSQCAGSRRCTIGRKQIAYSVDYCGQVDMPVDMSLL